MKRGVVGVPLTLEMLEELDRIVEGERAETRVFPLPTRASFMRSLLDAEIRRREAKKSTEAA